MATFSYEVSMDVFAELLNYNETSLTVPAADHAVDDTVDLINDVTFAVIHYTIINLVEQGSETELLLQVIE